MIRDSFDLTFTDLLCLAVLVEESNKWLRETGNTFLEFEESPLRIQTGEFEPNNPRCIVQNADRRWQAMTWDSVINDWVGTTILFYDFNDAVAWLIGRDPKLSNLVRSICG
jgi:hypothetical protein